MKVTVDVPNWPNNCETTLEDAVQCQLETAFDSMVVDGLLSNYVDFTVNKTDDTDWKSKYMYLAAEFENYKKRQRTIETNTLIGKARKVTLTLLPVIDDAERSLKYETSETFNILYNNLINAAKNLDIYKMNIKIGDKFNPDIMEATAVITVDDPTMNNMVMDIVKPGYKTEDFISRYAQVVVGKYND